MSSHSILRLATPNISLSHQFSKELGVSKILAQILINRKITTLPQAAKFLKSSLNDLKSRPE